MVVFVKKKNCAMKMPHLDIRPLLEYYRMERCSRLAHDRMRRNGRSRAIRTNFFRGEA